jgi:hypothetical protein
MRMLGWSRRAGHGRWPRVVAGFAIVALASIVLAGCGGSSSAKPEDTVKRPSANPPAFHQTEYDTETTWEQKVSDAKVGGYLQSVWTDPGGPEFKLVIDSRPSEGEDSPLAAAELARTKASGMTGYHERMFKKTTFFGGPTGIYYAYNVGEEFVIGIFLAECGTSVYLHGTAPPTAVSDFSYFYKTVASRVKPVCNE